MTCRNNKSGLKLNSRDEEFIQYLKQNNNKITSTTKKLGERFGCAEKTIRRMTKKFEEAGILLKSRRNKWMRTLTYELTVKGRSLASSFKTRSSKKIKSAPIKPAPKTPSVVIRSQMLNYEQNLSMLVFSEKNAKCPYINKSYNKSHKSNIERKVKKTCPSLPEPVTNDPRLPSSSAMDMIVVWNSETGEKVKPDQGMCRFLIAAFKQKFNYSLKKWREYVQRFKSCEWLKKWAKKVGKGFDIMLALGFKVMNRILSTIAADVSDDTERLSDEELDEKAQAHIASVSEPEECKEVRKEILKEVGPGVYMSCFSRDDIEVRLTDSVYTGKVVWVLTKNNFVRDYVNNNYYHRGKLSHQVLPPEEVPTDEFFMELYGIK
jgi:DNA-binding MarR family transcriptional regulator